MTSGYCDTFISMYFHLFKFFPSLQLNLMSDYYVYRIIGPAMPSAEMLAAAAALTEAATAMR